MGSDFGVLGVNWLEERGVGEGQTVFANYLNVTPNLVSKWERGEKRPSGPALKPGLWSRNTE